MNQNNRALTGGPAFPSIFYNDEAESVTAPDGQRVLSHHSASMVGATLRDLFAGMALQGRAALRIERGDAGNVADLCYVLADAMVARRAIEPMSCEGPKAKEASGSVDVGFDFDARLLGEAKALLKEGAAKNESEALGVLHKVASALGMMAGSNVVRDVLPVLHMTLDELRRERKKADIDRLQAQLLLAENLGLGDLDPAIEKSITRAAAAGGGNTALAGQRHIAIVGTGAGVGVFGANLAKPAPPIPAHLRPFVEEVAAMVRGRPESKGVMVECDKCAATGVSELQLTHSADCVVGEARRLLALKGGAS